MKSLISDIKLKNLITKKDVDHIIRCFMKATNSEIGIYDLDGELIMGKGEGKSSTKHPIELLGYEIGWIKGEGEEDAAADFLNYIVYSEYEKRALAREIMDRYREVSFA